MGEVANATPANWQRPPFEPGNEAARRHGAYTRRWFDQRAAEIRDEILTAPGNEYLGERRWLPGVYDLVELERRREKLLDHMEELGGLIAAMTETETTDSEEVRTSGGGSRRMSTTRRMQALLTGLEKTEAAIRKLRNDLGLTPMSRARLGRDVAAAQVDMASMLTQLRENSEKATKDQQGAGHDDQR